MATRGISTNIRSHLCPRMRCLSRKSSQTFVAHKPKAPFICRRHISSLDRAISYRRYITRSARNGYHCKNPLLSTRQKRVFTWRAPEDSVNLCRCKATALSRLFASLCFFVPCGFLRFSPAPIGRTKHKRRCFRISCVWRALEDSNL